MKEDMRRRANTQEEGESYVLVPPTKFNINSPNIAGASILRTSMDSNINSLNVGGASMEKTDRANSNHALFGTPLIIMHHKQKKKKKTNWLTSVMVSIL